MPKFIKSWKGRERLRNELVRVAHDVVASDAAVRAHYRSPVATALICEAMRDPGAVTPHEIKRAADAQNTLFEMQRALVWEHGLDFDFVRNVWAPILDPLEPQR